MDGRGTVHTCTDATGYEFRYAAYGVCPKAVHAAAPRSISSLLPLPHSDSGDWSGTASAPGYYEAHSEEAAAFGTMWTQLYAAPHMRFGAMVLGALLAFFLPEEGAASGDRAHPPVTSTRAPWSGPAPLHIKLMYIPEAPVLRRFRPSRTACPPGSLGPLRPSGHL